VRRDAGARTGAALSVPADATKEVLRRPLNAARAAQIALANNRHLRATLEELGISQAEFALAVTPHNPSLFASLRFPSGGGKSNPEFGLTQEILDLLLLPAKKKIARNQLDQALRRVTREVVELAAETREAFHNL